MKRRTRLRLVARQSSLRLALPQALPVAIIPQNVSFTKCDNGHNHEQTCLLEGDASPHFHLYPKGAALFEMMGKDAVRRFFDFI